MVWIAIIALVLGVLCGLWVFPPAAVDLFSLLADGALYLLMFLVGISVGTNKNVLRKMKEYNLTVLLIPFGIVVGSIVGGGICALILKMPLREGTAIASGLGWYSLSGVMLSGMAGAEVGAIAFLGNLLREILSFLMIPFIVRHFNAYTAIAPAGATSEDTTLPMMVKYTSEDVVILSVLNGVICSALVPVLINFFYSLPSI
ncbi:MAG: lysine exporter LysO family protein [Massiliimalia sp.]